LASLTCHLALTRRRAFETMERGVECTRGDQDALVASQFDEVGDPQRRRDRASACYHSWQSGTRRNPVTGIRCWRGGNSKTLSQFQRPVHRGAVAAAATLPLLVASTRDDQSSRRRHRHAVLTASPQFLGAASLVLSNGDIASMDPPSTSASPFPNAAVVARGGAAARVPTRCRLDKASSASHIIETGLSTSPSAG
jgi:hypothetical protein